MVPIPVCVQEQYDEGLFDFGNTFEDGTLDRVIRSLEAIRESIPEEYRAAATCGIMSESGYEGSHYARIEVSYDRPETDEEMQRREKRDRDHEAAIRREERALLKRLQNKYRDD
jgi:hypothetical protein